MTRAEEREQLTQEKSALRAASDDKDEELEQLREAKVALREGLRQALQIIEPTGCATRLHS